MFSPKNKRKYLVILDHIELLDLKLYNETLHLLRNSYGYKKIAQILSERYSVKVSPSTIYKWILNLNSPLGRYNFPAVSPDLSYVIGAWLGDGTLAFRKSKQEYIIKLLVKDYEFANEWGKRLSHALQRSRPYKPVWDKANKRWCVKGYSKILYVILRETRRNLSIVEEIVSYYPAEAIRGFFDAEGSITNNPPIIIACNTRLDIIRLFQRLLSKISIKSNISQRYRDLIMECPKTGKIYLRNTNVIYCLKITHINEIMKYFNMVGFTIKRKQYKLESIIHKWINKL